jgi:hypothetical protein
VEDQGVVERQVHGQHGARDEHRQQTFVGARVQVHRDVLELRVAFEVAEGWVAQSGASGQRVEDRVVGAGHLRQAFARGTFVGHDPVRASPQDQARRPVMKDPFITPDATKDPFITGGAEGQRQRDVARDVEAVRLVVHTVPKVA